ncbi:unnamed protein product [Clonostachys chloroleuca]|uniref:Nephrocystin 3-like N-terminal domain-containing protein n=1 Tax=Clonostachys chloroleuca TaxID=1926264 RepID=A0AA35Q399_9HYPO|nr:unnamed protein product [Clonostachys chloroleuca]
MIGIRNSINRRRRRNNSNPSVKSDTVEEHPQPPPRTPPRSSAMEAIRGLSDSITGKSHNKPHERAVVSVNEASPSISDDDAEGDQTFATDITAPSLADGDTNGSLGANTKIKSLDYFHRVKDVFKSVTKKIVRIDEYDESFVRETDLHVYLQYISDERLIHMPRRGSDWDRVLGAAQFFGLQIWSFGDKINAFVPGAKDSAAAALVSCQILLELGHGQAQALLPTFIALYELAMLLCTVGQIRGLEHMPPVIKEDAASLFCDLVGLTGSIAIHYREKITAYRSGAKVKINFDTTFGKQITAIWDGKEQLQDHIWTSKLGRKRFSFTVPALRAKLQSPTEVSSVRGTLYDEVLESLERSEDTCYWIKHEIVQFFNSNEQVLSVTGPAGSGKSILAEWVQERLTRPLDQKHYIVLDYTFPFDSPVDANSLACIKSLINQLLDRSVGDIALFAQLVHAFEEFAAHQSTKQLEASLWKAFRSGLQAAEHGGATIVIIVDGCDEIAFHTTLRTSASKLPHVRVITFSRPVSHLSDGCKHIVITQQEVKEDIKAHLWENLSKVEYFHSKLDVGAREALVDELAEKSKGNFLWAFFAGRLLQGATLENYTTVKHNISSDVKKLLPALVGHTRLKDDTLRHLLSFMVVASRPLTIQEAAELLATNTTKREMEKQTLDLIKFIPEKCGDVVVLHGGRLHFRSSLVLSFLQEQMGHTLLSVRETHLQLASKLLLYARLHLESDREPLIDELDDSVVEKLLGSHHLLLYVVQNWTVHFKAAGLVGAGGEIALPKGFVDLFPHTVTFSLLERTCWDRLYTHQDVVGVHELALKIRETTFGEKHLTVLQGLITLGHVHRRISVTSTHGGATYLVRAVRLGQVVLSEYSAIVAACASLFLSWTETLVITQRTEIVTYREEMIRVMIKICKQKHGQSSDQVIFWYEALAKLYVEIKEVQNATIVYRELYEIVIIRHGKKSTKARQIGNVFGTLDVVLKGEDAAKDTKELEVLIFETNDDMEVTDQLCISMMIRLAQSYISCGKLFLAERLYVSLWRRVSAMCTAGARIEVHISKIQIALEYVKFLRKVDRSVEASNILICLWAEYEHHTFESEILIIWLREIGTVCRSFGLLTISASILTKVWGWFKSKGKTKSEEAQRTTVLITQVVEEITETATTKKTTKITTTEVTETVVREIFELQYTRCKTTTVDREFFSACLAVIGLYIQNENWSEAEVIIKRTLEISWKAMLSADIKISLSQSSTKESIAVARRLALCYHRQGLLEQAEQTYLRIYYACLQSIGKIDQVYTTEAIQTLIDFYEGLHRHERVTQIYVEVLEVYRKQYGHNSHLVIQLMYKLAAQHEMLGHHTDAYKQYLEIVTILNKGIKYCHQDAVKAALFLCRHYNTRKMWTGLREICGVVWETILHHREKCSHLEIEVISEIYEKYAYVLEFHAKVAFSVLYQVTVQYKEVVTVISGGDSNSKAVLLALITLAKICEKHESHHHESVKIYEEVLTKTTTTKTTETIITETTVHTIKKRLSKMYVTIITSGKGGPATPATVERAIAVCFEAYVQLKVEYGVWHEITLLKLKDLVILYQKVNSQHIRIIELLQQSVVEIITTLTVTTTLFAAATTLAGIYTSVGLVNKGQELLQQLRHLIIFRGGWTTTEITLKIDVQMSKVAFTFLIAFELGLLGKGKTISHSEMMADILFESLLFVEYSRVIEKETKLEVILEAGAKLRIFWEEHKRTQLLEILDKKLLQLFRAQYVAEFKTIGEENVRTFYLAILLQLGKDQRASEIDFPALACKAGNNKVRALLETAEFRQGHQVGRAVFQLAIKHRIFHHARYFHIGYKLAELLAGIDVAHPKEQELSKAMKQTSSDIMRDVLATAYKEGVDFADLKFEDLSGLIRLLGAQGNFTTLEELLSKLWDRREELQRSRNWSPIMVLRVGNLLVHAQQNSKKTAAAINTAELLYYNIRRGRGRLDPDTLAVSMLLASLYVSSGRVASAMDVHETVLREVSFISLEQYSSERRAAIIADTRLQLERLREAHVRTGGKARPVAEFKDLYDRLNQNLKLELPAFEKWIEIGNSNKTVQNANYISLLDWAIGKDTAKYIRAKRWPHRRSKVEDDQAKETTQWWLVH